MRKQEGEGKPKLTYRQDSLRGALLCSSNSRCGDSKSSGERTLLLLPCLPGQGAQAFPYLYWIVSDVVDARNFVIRILTMLNRNTKLIWKKTEWGRHGKVCKWEWAEKKNP